MPYVAQIQPNSYLVGQIGDSNPYSLLSEINVNSGTIPFGIAMIFNGTDNGYDLPTSSGDITNRMAINAIASRDQNAYYSSPGVWVAGDTSGVAPTQTAVGLIQGDIAVTVEEAVLLGDPCYIRFANGSDPAWTQKGAFRKSADTVSSAATAAVHPSWYFASAAAAGGIAIVRAQ